MSTDFDDHQRRLWAGKAEAYAASFGLLCAGAAPDMLDFVEAGIGTKLLDVGTGPGTVALLAQQRGATVAAVDPERTMVETAREHVPDVRLGTLPDLPFIDGTFDVAVANFVLNFVSDPAASVRGMARVVRSGGSVAVTVWPEPAPVNLVTADAVRAAGVGPAARKVPRAEVEFPRTEDGLAGLLRRAGLHDVEGRTLTWTHRVDPEVWWSGPANGVAAIGATVTSQTPETRIRIKQEFDRLAADLVDAEGMLPLPVTAFLARGRV